MTPALTQVASGVRLRLRVKPGASRVAVLGRTILADGSEAVVVAVSAPPEDGKANAAVIALLTKSWRLPKSRIDIVAGAAARTKLVEITGESAVLMATIGPWLAVLQEV